MKTGKSLFRICIWYVHGSESLPALWRHNRARYWCVRRIWMSTLWKRIWMEHKRWFIHRRSRFRKICVNVCSATSQGEFGSHSAAIDVVISPSSDFTICRIGNDSPLRELLHRRFCTGFVDVGGINEIWFFRRGWVVYGGYVRYCNYFNCLTCFPHCYFVRTFWISTNSLCNSKTHASIDRTLPGITQVPSVQFQLLSYTS